MGTFLRDKSAILQTLMEVTPKGFPRGIKKTWQIKTNKISNKKSNKKI